MSLPSKILNQGHLATLFLYDSKLSIEVSKLVNQGHYEDCFEVVCKVEEIQQSAEKNDKIGELHLVTLKCLQYEKAIWDELANKLGDLQEAINRLFL